MRIDPASLAESLRRLTEALTALDHAAVDDCLADLEAARAGLGPDMLSATDLSVLGFRLRAASMLTASAGDLYGGWSRVASPPGDAYLPNGCEPVPVRRRSMNVDG